MVEAYRLTLRPSSDMLRRDRTAVEEKAYDIRQRQVGMRQSKMLKKIREGRCARICGLGHYLPFFVRYAAHSGYDGIWLDLEHRAMDQREVQALLARLLDLRAPPVRPMSYEKQG